MDEVNRLMNGGGDMGRRRNLQDMMTTTEEGADEGAGEGGDTEGGGETDGGEGGNDADGGEMSGSGEE